MTDRKQKWHVGAAIFATILLVLIASLGFVYYFAGKSAFGPESGRESEMALPDRNPEGQSGSESRSTAGWKTYQFPDKRLEFKYPEGKLTLAKKENGIVLSHSVPFKHTDPCDMRDGAAKLAELTDFKTDFRYMPKSLAESVRASEPDFFAQDNLSQNELLESPGFIDAVKFGAFSAYKVTSSVEGCGEYVYYLILDQKNTLRINRSIITEFQPVLTDFRENLKLPGIISPTEEERIFDRMVSSLKWTGENNIEKEAAELE